MQSTPARSARASGADRDGEARALAALAAALRSTVDEVTASASTSGSQGRSEPTIPTAALADGIRAAATRLGQESRERRLLALAVLHALELELAGLTVERRIGPIPEGLDTAVVALAERALTCAADNVLTHAGATSALVSLLAADDAVYLVVADDGVGFRPTDVLQPPGARRANRPRLAVLRTDVERVGGELRIGSDSGRGTLVEIRLPAPAGGSHAACAW